MPPIYPDLAWYSAESERKALPGRCPYASIHLCPRYFCSAALLSDTGTTARLQEGQHDRALERWREHDLAPATAETETSISGGTIPNCYSNFCPEVAYETFKLFGSTLIRIIDDPTDRLIAEQAIKEDPAPPGKDWRWSWSHIEPLHFADCPLYAQLKHQEKPMPNITFNAPVTGNVNVAGHTITAPVMSLSISDLLLQIETSSASAPEKEAAKSKLAEFLSHPVVSAIVGGIAGKIGG